MYNYIYSSYKQFQMDILVSHYIQIKMDKQSKTELSKTELNNNYSSPKRAHVCASCGQQDHWCVCHLNKKNDT